MQKLLTFFFSKHFNVYAIFNDQSFNDSLTNDIVSFEQLGPGPLEIEIMRINCINASYHVCAHMSQ